MNAILGVEELSRQRSFEITGERFLPTQTFEIN